MGRVSRFGIAILALVGLQSRLSRCVYVNVRFLAGRLLQSVFPSEKTRSITTILSGFVWVWAITVG